MGNKRKFDRKNDNALNALLHTCAWCKKTISQDSEVFGFGAKANPGIDLSDKEGEFVALSSPSANKTLVALVTVKGSPSRQAGYDLMFVTCSQECAQDLKDSIERERDLSEQTQDSIP